MSDTETRDEAVEPTPAQWVEHFLSLPPGVQERRADFVQSNVRIATACVIRRHEQELSATRAEMARLTHLLGSHADGHRCTCTMTDPGKPGIEPPEWEQDPWCPTHPDVDVVLAEVARLREAVERVRALCDEDSHDLRSGVPGMVRLSDLRAALAPVEPSGETVHGALARAEALAAGDPRWMDRTTWPFPSRGTETPRRYSQCDETCTTDCGHCKGLGRPSGETESGSGRVRLPPRP
jgi:hypothetical protein